MFERLMFLVNRLREKLWIRPLMMCILSLFGAFLAKGMESLPFAPTIPLVSMASVEILLTTLSASMLVIATFAVGSMVSSLASAGSTATPRTFPLIVSDDTSQNALSIFIGAFIFSLVSITFLKNGFYNEVGVSALFLLTVMTFAVVILTFVRWVDSIARLGRLGATIDKTVAVTQRSLERRRRAPTMRCGPVTVERGSGQPVHAARTGYVQRIDMESLQVCAEALDVSIVVRSLPGAFAAPDRVLAEIAGDGERSAEDVSSVEEAFRIGDRRTFDEDPRFGLVVLSEIAGRALSPAVNDPGTAIDIIGALVRLFVSWSQPGEEDESPSRAYDRVEAPVLCTRDMFDDAFISLARDGAGSVEVAVKLQKALRSLALLGDPFVREAAMAHSRLALRRAEKSLGLPEDLELVRELASFSENGTKS